MTEYKVWKCKIGVPLPVDLPSGADSPMRNAVAEACAKLTGKDYNDMEVFSGWGGAFTEGELAVLENRVLDPRLDESKPSLNMFEEAIRQWGIDRNITPEGGATVMAQMSKLMEEFAEFLQTWDLIQELNLRLVEQGNDGGDIADIEGAYKQLDDDFGDMLVCLIQAMRLAGTDMETCLAKAWNDIKDRKGTMVAGKFVKESP